MITWDDGVWLDKPKFTMTGFTAKRVSETKLSKEVQTTVLTIGLIKSHLLRLTSIVAILITQF